MVLSEGTRPQGLANEVVILSGRGSERRAPRASALEGADARDSCAPESAIGALFAQLEATAPSTPRAAAVLSSRSGYLRGVRAGRLAGFVWGLLLGGLAVAAAVKLGVGAGS